jgi:hypothetical protein
MVRQAALGLDPLTITAGQIKIAKSYVLPLFCHFLGPR